MGRGNLELPCPNQHNTKAWYFLIDSIIMMYYTSYSIMVRICYSNKRIWLCLLACPVKQDDLYNTSDPRATSWFC